MTAILLAAALLLPAHACPSGLYGLSGEWGPGSLLADTPRNRAIIRSRYAPRKAYRVIHNIEPSRCR